MYLFLLFEAVVVNSHTSYNDGLKMIKKSLLFQSSRKNTMYSYFLVVLELVSFSTLVATFYSVSNKVMGLMAMFTIICMLFSLYIMFSTLICFYFDEEDIMNRIRVESLDAETIERLENVLRSEETENSNQISVPTNCLASNGLVET